MESDRQIGVPNNSFERILLTAMRMPGVCIDRSEYLRSELSKHFPKETVDLAISQNPARAGIDRKQINRISLNAINFETAKVTALSIAASLPGGVAAVGAAGADILSYFAHILRVVQKLAYLYGFEDFELSSGNMDDGTMYFIMVFVGMMFGVQGANTALRKFAEHIGKNASKIIARKALSKTAVFPIVKKIAEKVGIKMTRQIFADTVASAIPVLGGGLSGVLTYAMFKPCCLRYRKNLMSYNISDPSYYRMLRFTESDENTLVKNI